MSNENSDYFTEMVKLIAGLGVVAVVVVFILSWVAGLFGGTAEQDQTAVNERLQSSEVVSIVGGPAPKAKPEKAKADVKQEPKLEAKAESKQETAQKTEAKPAAASGGEEGMGKVIYSKTCFACHGTGILNSPKKGDAAEWKKRLDAVGGIDGLVKSSITGKGGMPPKGGAANLTDEDLKAAIEFMMK